MKKKILIIMISLICVFCLAFATSGCDRFGIGTGSGNTTENSENSGNPENSGNSENGEKEENNNSEGNNGDAPNENGIPDQNKNDDTQKGGSEENNNAEGNNGGSPNENGNPDQNKNGDTQNGGSEENKSGSSNELGAIKKYTVYTENAGGARLKGVTVKVTRNGEDVTSKVATSGYAQFSVAAGDYDLSYENLPAGYYVDPSYTATKLSKDGTTVHAKFKSQVIDEPLTAPYSYKQGDIMHNFVFTDADGVTVELKELLKTHKLVLLNFWYDGCMYCEQELPAIEGAYRNRKDDVFVVAVSNLDSNADVKKYKADHGCTFFMAADTENIVSKSFAKLYPTNAIIDQFGVIRFLDYGSRPQQSFWENKFTELISDGN